MLLLLDENLPKKLKHDFIGHQTFTIRDKGWEGITNGNLLTRMTSEKFDALITFDKNLQYQKNFNKYTITVFVLVAQDNSYVTLKDFVPKVLKLINKGISPGPIEVRI